MTGTPDFELVDTPEAYRRAARALSHGRGPFAVDTERASTFRYDDRAFLVQVFRRDAGTFLIAPEGHRDEVREAFAPVMGGRDWILHAAGEDLPSLAALGLYPGTLFDTELAARIGGFDRSNLAAMVERFTGVTLEKGHGREDWSSTPLPREWQIYAAHDVIHLNALAEAQAEHLDRHGKLGMAAEEFDHIVGRYAVDSVAPQRTWRDLKGVPALTSPADLQVARALWEERERDARRTDTAAHALLPNRVLLDLARAHPRTPSEIARVPGFPRRRGAAERWSRVIAAALDSAPETWPRPRRMTGGAPGKQWWERHHPESWAQLQAARSAVSDRAAALDMPAENLLQSAVLRATVWDIVSGDHLRDTDAVARRLAAHGARAWQVEQCATGIAGGLAGRI